MRHFIHWTILILFILGIGYGFLWYASRETYHVDFGISFSKGHATTLGLDWQKSFLAMLDELKPKYLRLSAPWNEIESSQGRFETTDLDWQMAQALKARAKVTLVIGQKAPRWPECHVPSWAGELKGADYQGALFTYVKYIVERYKNHPALEIWQVENEPFIKFQFGNCTKYDMGVVKDEIGLVKLLDKEHKIIVTDSGELSTWGESIKAADLFGTTIYRIVRTPQGWRWSYDWLPPAFYWLKAEFWSRQMNAFYISELQAEPWFSNGNPLNTVLAEQEKTMNPERLKNHLNFAQRVGVSRAYLWGVEWWYWMKEKQNDPRYWDIVREAMTK